MTFRTKPARVWQRMLSGRRLDLLDPSPLDIEIEDIAHGLARVARWNGQTRGPHIYSVAQHSVLVELIGRRQAGARGVELDRRWKLAMLLHDAPEYVVGDMISPFKAVLGGNYREVEERLLSAISLRFGLPAHWPATLAKLVKSADRASAFLEATRLAGFELAEAKSFFGRPFPLDAGEEQAYLAPWSADEAASRFLSRFTELIGEGPAGAAAPRAIASGA
ncbi:YfbR-like 5'-deoxynucleotidase [Ancylobacter pratisalsi]|uniref:HD family hydrolase n=1 Tax=Ancylobacter pratisalsi TaxID=1745854 RepID=A0A6P1YLM7_9HYPH|nr:HD family hydrolase [Ancylobacter pratisalsi]QIB33880.1 HD family hydrolase [Ancylobacter pratisalsi]